VADRPDPCERCGHRHRQCARGVAATTGRLCCAHPVHGTTLCKWHGGQRKRQRLAAAARALEDDARKLLPPREEWEPVVSAVGELLAVATEQKAVREMLLRMVAALEESEQVVTDKVGRQTINPAIEAAQNALESSTRVNAVLARLRIDERRLELAERDEQFCKAIILAALNLFGIPSSDERLDVLMPRAVQTARLQLVSS
jgi:hypothetical protein